MSTLTIRHGHRVTPVWTGPLEDPPPIGRWGPHHAMLPRALEPLKRLGLDEHLWSDLAPVLDDVLAGRGDPYPVGDLSETVVGGVAHAARAAGVRTWGMSMLTALDYARASSPRRR